MGSCVQRKLMLEELSLCENHYFMTFLKMLHLENKEMNKEQNGSFTYRIKKN